MKVAQLLNEAEQRVKKLQRDWKRNIAKSRQCSHLFGVLLFFVILCKKHSLLYRSSMAIILRRKQQKL